MAEPGTFHGVRGLVKHAYHTAAEVSEFLITLKTGALAGHIARSDPFLLTQTPLVFVIPTARGALRYPIDSLTITPEGNMVARLGALQKE